MTRCIAEDALTMVLTLGYVFINGAPYLTRVVVYVSKAERVLYTKIQFLLRVSDYVES